MRRTGILIIMTIVFFSCNHQNSTDKIQKKFDKENYNNEAKSNIIFYDSVTSSIVIVRNAQNQIIEEKFCNVEYDYETIKLDGKLKFVYKREIKNITRRAGYEGQKCQYQVNFYDKKDGKHLKTIIEDVDELDFNTNYYIGTNWGCCGSENECFIKNTDNGNLFLEYNERFFHVDIPNSNVELFCGFKPEDREFGENGYVLNDNLTIGKLIYSDLDGIINTVVFHAKDEYTYQGILHRIPDMEFIKTNRDKISNNELEFWSNNKIENTNQINDIGFSIIFINDITGMTDTLKYLIQNGYLNGIKKTIIHDTIVITAPKP